MKLLGEEIATAINNGDTVAIKFKESNRYYFVDDDGNIEGPMEILFDTTPGTLDGTGTEADPFVIMSIEDLVEFSINVSEYNGKYISLGKTLDFQSDLSYIDVNTTDYDSYLNEEGDGATGLKEQLTNGLGFIPINNFTGTFDGNNNTIKNIYINKNTNNVGLFGITVLNAIIQNLNITGKIIGLENVGGIAGTPKTAIHYIQIINCNNYAKVEGTTVVGGIIGNGSGATIKNCNNYENVIGTKITGTKVGGITGINGKISSCTNYGTISGPEYIGGICGVPNAGKIFECVNVGEVKGESYIGGICGFSGNGGTIERCYNTADITGKRSAGGIAGLVYRSSYIKCAYNTGKVEGDTYVGGIIGERNWAAADINSLNCYNIGEVTGKTNVGEVLGNKGDYIYKMYYLETSTNEGKGIGANNGDIEGVVEGRTEQESKSGEFLDLLNEEHIHNVDGTEVDYTGSCWVKDTNNINSGYPIFSYQVEE